MGYYLTLTSTSQLVFDLNQMQREIDTPSLYGFSKFQPTKKWVNKVNWTSFELQNFLKFVPA